MNQADKRGFLMFLNLCTVLSPAALGVAWYLRWVTFETTVVWLLLVVTYLVFAIASSQAAGDNE